jgi:hypothetical protein
MATLLACIGLLALIGCILVPGNYQTEDGKPRPETQIGTSKQNKPLRLEEATRADVERVLGPSSRVSPDGRTVVYTYEVNTMTFITLCYGLSPSYDSRHLILRFTEDGRLSEYRLTKDQGEANAAINR